MNISLSCKYILHGLINDRYFKIRVRQNAASKYVFKPTFMNITWDYSAQILKKEALTSADNIFIAVADIYIMTSKT